MVADKVRSGSCGPRLTHVCGWYLTRTCKELLLVTALHWTVQNIQWVHIFVLQHRNAQQWTCTRKKEGAGVYLGALVVWRWKLMDCLKTKQGWKATQNTLMHVWQYSKIMWTQPRIFCRVVVLILWIAVPKFQSGIYCYPHHGHILTLCYPRHNWILKPFKEALSLVSCDYLKKTNAVIAVVGSMGSTLYEGLLSNCTLTNKIEKLI